MMCFFSFVFLLLSFFTPFSFSQNVSVLFAIVSIEGPSGFVSPSCSESDVRSLAYSDSRNLNGWITATSWNVSGLAPENETLIIVRNVTLNDSTCNLFEVLGQVEPTINGSWDFHIFVMPTVSEMTSVGVNCPEENIISIGSVGFIFRCSVPADYARAYVLSEGSFRYTNALCPCPADPFFSNCTDETCIAIGDISDILQGGDELDRTLNAPNREAVLGGGPWLQVVPDLLAFEGEVIFNLTDLATGPPNETLALKIKSLDTSTWLYLSCRSPETIFYDDGNGSDNSTMFHIHTVPVGTNPLTSNATLETFLNVGEVFILILSVSNETDIVFILSRNLSPLSECSISMVVTGFFTANGSIGGSVFDGPTSQPVFAGLFDSDIGSSFIFSPPTIIRYLPGRSSISLSPLTEPNPDFPGPLGDGLVLNLISATFEEVIRFSQRIDDSDGIIVGNWTNSSEPSGALLGFFLETIEVNSSVTFEFPQSLHSSRPFLCQTFIYWMHTEDPLSTGFNSSVDRFDAIPVSIFGAFSTINLFLDQRRFVSENSTGSGNFTGSGAQMKALIGEIYMNANSSVVINSVFNRSVSTDGVEFSCLDPLKGNGGNLSLLVVSVNITDGVYSGTPICSGETLAENLEDILTRDSFGAATFETVNITQRNLTITESNISSCAYFDWARELFESINDMDNKTLDNPPLSGIRVPNFDHIFILFPNDTGCEWDLVSGLSHPLSIITDCTRAGHALGHNLGLGHAGDENCTEPCVVEDSLMGTGSVLNAPMRIGTGWLSPNRITDVSASGEFALDRLDVSFNESLPLVLLMGLHLVSCRNNSIDIHFYESGFPAPASYLHSQLLASLTTESEKFSFVSSDLREVNVSTTNVSQCLVSMDIFTEFVLGACCVNITTCFESNLISLCENGTFFPGQTCSICDTLFASTSESTTSAVHGACCFLIINTTTCSQTFTQAACEVQPGTFVGGIGCSDQVGCCDDDNRQCLNLTFSSCCNRKPSLYINSCIEGDPCDFGLSTITSSTITTTTSTTTTSTTSTTTTTTSTTTTSTTITTSTSTTETSIMTTSTTTFTSETESTTTTEQITTPVVPFEVWLLVPIFAGVCCVMACLCLFIMRGVRPTNMKTKSNARQRSRLRKPLL